MVVRADLDRAVPGVGDLKRHRLAAGIELDLAVLDKEFAGDHDGYLVTHRCVMAALPPFMAEFEASGCFIELVHARSRAWVRPERSPPPGHRGSFRECRASPGRVSRPARPPASIRPRCGRRARPRR